MGERSRSIAVGAGAALAVAFPATLAAQITDALSDGDDPPVAVYALVPLILVAMALGGWVVGRRARPHPWLEGGLAGLIAMVIVLGLGVLRRTAAGSDVQWTAVPFTMALAVALAVAGSAVGARSPARTRP